MKRVAMLVLLAALVMIGCNSSDRPVFDDDLKLEREIFMECLASVPKGPESTKYNDWDEVIMQCANVADTLSVKCVRNCQDELNVVEPIPAK